MEPAWEAFAEKVEQNFGGTLRVAKVRRACLFPTAGDVAVRELSGKHACQEGIRDRLFKDTPYYSLDCFESQIDRLFCQHMGTSWKVQGPCSLGT